MPTTPVFVFVQLDFPWELGLADGRYLLRARQGGEPERVLVLQTIKDAPASASRITLIDPVSLPAESQASAWLEDAERDREHTLEEALSVLNRILYLHRISSADPYAHEVSASQAIAIRAGWGSGEELASGRYTQARELPAGRQAGERRGLLRLGRGRRARASALASQERLATLLGAHVPTLLSEELALRARLDLEQGRAALAAYELDTALATAVDELRREERPDLALRIDELDQLRSGLAAQRQDAPGADRTVDEDALAHALGRLEAALRVRAGLAGKDRFAG